MTPSPVGIARTNMSSSLRMALESAHLIRNRTARTCSTKTLENLERLQTAQQFIYVFDFGDDWTHLCTVVEASIDPREHTRYGSKRPLTVLWLGKHPGSIRSGLGRRRCRISTGVGSGANGLATAPPRVGTRQLEHSPPNHGIFGPRGVAIPRESRDLSTATHLELGLASLRREPAAGSETSIGRSFRYQSGSAVGHLGWNLFRWA